MQSYEEKKRSHLNTAALCSQEGFGFTPTVVEAHGGGWGLEVRRVFSTIACNSSARRGSNAGIIADQLSQRLFCLLHRENARAVLSRLPGWTAGCPPGLLQAAAVASGS